MSHNWTFCPSGPNKFWSNIWQLKMWQKNVFPFLCTRKWCVMLLNMNFWPLIQSWGIYFHSSWVFLRWPIAWLNFDTSWFFGEKRKRKKKKQFLGLFYLANLLLQFTTNSFRLFFYNFEFNFLLFLQIRTNLMQIAYIGLHSAVEV